MLSLFTNKNTVDKSYFVEVPENLTAFVMECNFVAYAMKERGGKQNNSISFNCLVCCLLRATKSNL